MPRISCPHTGWTELTSSAGPDLLTVQRETWRPFWVVFAASDPGDEVRTPADAADYVMINDDFPGLATAALAGGSLRAWARPVTDDTVTVNATQAV